MATGWSVDEVRATVGDYFEMLEAELTGEQFNKAEHRRRLLSQLRGRSPGAIERKHGNISAILLEEGFPFVDGYKPLRNYQRALREEVLRFVHEHPELRRLIEQVEGQLPLSQDIASLIAADLFVEPPEHEAHVFSGPAPMTRCPAAFYDLELKDERIRRLGIAGEQFVVSLEQARLEQAGRADLAKNVE